jgi:hypothetical protein
LVSITPPVPSLHVKLSNGSEHEIALADDETAAALREEIVTRAYMHEDYVEYEWLESRAGALVRVEAIDELWITDS